MLLKAILLKPLNDLLKLLKIEKEILGSAKEIRKTKTGKYLIPIRDKGDFFKLSCFQLKKTTKN